MYKCTDGNTQSVPYVRLEIHPLNKWDVKNSSGTSNVEQSEDHIHLLSPPTAAQSYPVPSNQENINLAQPFIFNSFLTKGEKDDFSKGTDTEEHFSTFILPSPEPTYSSTKSEEKMSDKGETAEDRLLWRTPDAHRQDSLLVYKSFFSEECDYIINQLQHKAVEGKSGSKRKLVDMEVSLIDEELPPFFCTPDDTPNMCSSKRKRMEQLGSKRNLNVYFQRPEILPYGCFSVANQKELSGNTNVPRWKQNPYCSKSQSAVNSQPLIGLKPLNCERSYRENCTHFVDPVSSSAKTIMKLSPVKEVAGESTASEDRKQNGAHSPPLQNLHTLPAQSASGLIFKSVRDGEHVAGIRQQNVKTSTNEIKVPEFLDKEEPVFQMETNSIFDGSLPDLEKMNFSSVNSILLENESNQNSKAMSNTREFQSNVTVSKDNSSTCELPAKVSEPRGRLCRVMFPEEGEMAKERTDAVMSAVNITQDIVPQHCGAAAANVTWDVVSKSEKILHNVTRDISVNPVEVTAASVTQDIVLGTAQARAANVTWDIVSKSEQMRTASVTQDIVLKHGEVAVDLEDLACKETPNRAIRKVASEMVLAHPANATQDLTHDIITAVNATQDIVLESNSGNVVEKVGHQEQLEVCRKSWEGESALDEGIFSNGSLSFITSTPVTGNGNYRCITGPVRIPVLRDPSSLQELPTTKALESKLPIQKRPLGAKLFEGNPVRRLIAKGSLLPHFVKRCNDPVAVEKEKLIDPPNVISSALCPLPTVASVIQPLKEPELSHIQPQDISGLGSTYVISSLARSDQPKTFGNNGPKSVSGTFGMVMHQKTIGNRLAPNAAAAKLGPCAIQLSKERMSRPPQMCSRSSGLCIPRGPRNGVSLQRASIPIKTPAGVQKIDSFGARQSVHPSPPLVLQATCPKKKPLPSGLPKLSKQRS
ncbi:uncharacterized protein LOC128503300 [Spea bombifrons]|uniref:uncharacterized protein LOC128503300 n=1 Tax=Spea bombifrons TaxID=233779 RepID=UPI00234BD585|nr:uncharacterized protein LOC128503300 [Spea bombifrons]